MKKRIGCFCVSFLIMFLNGLCMANESMVAHSEESSAYVIISTEPQEYTEIQRQKRTGFMKKMLSGLHEESWAAYAFWAAEAVEPGIPLHEYLEQLEKEDIYSTNMYLKTQSPEAFDVVFFGTSELKTAVFPGAK